MPFLRVVVEEGEESFRREKNRVCELQQQLEQERAVSLRKVKEEEERRGVRINMNEIVRTNTPAKRDLFLSGLLAACSELIQAFALL